jgi:fructokinase
MTDNNAQPVIFGEVLFDHFPDGSVVLGGAPFNVAWHLQALGIDPLFISRVGDDPLGRQILDTLSVWGMNPSGVQLDSDHPTGTVEVTFEQSEPHFDIVLDQAYDFIDGDALPAFTAPPLLYHGSLALRGPQSRNAAQRLLTRNDTPVFMDVNLRPPWWERSQLRELMQQARWVKLNDSELLELQAVGGDLEERARKLQQELELELVIVTLGNKGAMALDSNGTVKIVTPNSDNKLIDSVGAGDAFSAIVIYGLLQGWNLQEILERAQAFASAIVGIRGATPSDREFYKPFINDWS